jgi:hypothetical protein
MLTTWLRGTLGAPVRTPIAASARHVRRAKKNVDDGDNQLHIPRP